MNQEQKGHLHPITSVIREITLIFDKVGFRVAQGPELETEFYNFDALNVPPDHPARDMQDTFWVRAPQSYGFANTGSSPTVGDGGTKKHPPSPPFLGGESEAGGVGPRPASEEGSEPVFAKPAVAAPQNQKLVLRTHTSSVQVRFMESIKNNPGPFKIIIPGKVYRNEATDATHEAQFYQIEGLYMNEKVSMAELKGTLEYFFKEFLGPQAKIRFRASFFGFVEPGVEVDVWWQDSSGKGRWLEMFGAGLVHPNVIKSSGLDPKKWQGFAFGGGIDRLVLLRYGIDDIRHLYSGDLRLINQF